MSDVAAAGAVVSGGGVMGSLSTVATTFLIIFLAELGDKTQLACMTLSARFRGLPVFLGATAAFALLNVLAVVFGGALTSWIPEKILIIVVALLFAFFGIQSLRASNEEEEENDDAASKGGRSALVTAFLMIFLAELGDKTQIAVAGIAATAPPIPVWIGATLGLSLSAALAVIVGQKLLQRIPLRTVHKVSGIFFLLLAGITLTRLL
jgi:putative Ca2+/H+ antiporter (TMEM165/GDT1 family)